MRLLCGKWWTLQYPENNIDPATTMVRIERWGKSTGSKKQVQMSSSDYSVLHGVEHLHKLVTSTSICFDTETLQLKPESGKLRLLQLGAARKTIVLIDLFHTDEDGSEEIDLFLKVLTASGWRNNAAFDLGSQHMGGIQRVRYVIRCLLRGC